MINIKNLKVIALSLSLALFGGCGKKNASTSSDFSSSKANMFASEFGEAGLDRVHFALNKHTLDDVAKKKVAAIAAWLNDNKDSVVSILIEGHCDERGSAEYNLALGQRRADSVRKALAEAGVSDAVIKTISYGKNNPIDPGHNEDAWKKNRVGIVVID